MAATDPWWIEPALVIGGFVGTGLAAVTAAFRKSASPEAAAGTSVVAASVISDKSIEKMTGVIREAAESTHDDGRRVRESMSDLNDTMRDLTRAVREGLPPVASVDIAGLMARLDKVERSK